MEDKYQMLIQKRLEGRLTSADKAKIREIMKNPEEREELAFQIALSAAMKQRMDEIDELACEAIEAYEASKERGEKQKLPAPPSSMPSQGARRVQIRQWRKAAAAAAAILLLAYFAWLSIPSPQQQPTMAIIENSLPLVIGRLRGSKMAPEQIQPQEEYNHADCLELLRVRDYADGVECLSEKGRTLSPQDYFYLGYGLFWEKEYEQALSAFERTQNNDEILAGDLAVYKWATLMALAESDSAQYSKKLLEARNELEASDRSGKLQEIEERLRTNQ